MANPLANVAANLASRVRESAAGSKEDGRGNDQLGEVVDKASKVVASGASLISSIPSLKYIAIAVVVVIVLIFGGGALSGLGQAVSNATTSNNSCNDTSQNSTFIQKAQASGVTVNSQAQTDAQTVPNACGGVGFNGTTYPPTTGIITTYYGQKDALHPNPHTGLDIAGGCDVPIYAFEGGTVTEVVMGTEAKSTNGNFQFPAGYVKIKHTASFSTRYYHLRGSHTFVKVGDVVTAGQHIADQWSSGHSTGCHLHFEAYQNGVLEDPLPILKAAGYNYSKTAQFTEAMLPKAPVAGNSGGTAVTVTPGSAQAIAQAQVKAQGWPDTEFSGCLVPLWNRESGWRTNALNPAFAPSQAPTPENQAYGIPQAGPGSKMAANGPNWKTDAATQIAWGLGYIKARYGSPCGAWAHSQANNWY